MAESDNTNAIADATEDAAETAVEAVETSVEADADASGDDVEEVIVPEKDSQLFGEMLHKYLTLKNEYNEAEQLQKTKRIQIKQLETSIKSYIALHKIESVKLDGDFKGRTLIPQHKHSTIDKTTLIMLLKSYFTDANKDDEFEQIMTYITEHSVTRELYSLKLAKEPNKKKPNNKYETNNTQLAQILASTAAVSAIDDIDVNAPL
jgi:hypothetical protein